ncbi:fis family Sigma54 specific transcriptional regulator, partial [Achromobacter xylosoxidans C54]
VFARQLHARSRRAAGPFVAVNCAALPESLIESELFGYEDGAFTGARRQGSKGLLRQAHGGVLFLDEIGDMPLALQSRLLRVLQSREVSPLGAARPVPVDFTLVCATHRPLAHEGADAPVRADLYFRIAEYTVTLAPLRQRADLRELLRAQWAAQGAGPVLPAGIEETLVRYAWPGNYR